MIVGESDPKGTIVIGLTPNDIAQMKMGRTKTKHGGPKWSFRELILFMGERDEDMIKLLSTQVTIRQDDLFPEAGSG